MKHLFLTLALAFLAGISAMAQTDSLSEAYSRIKLLEQQLQQQNSQISKLSADVNEVLKQNLALKKNLNLQPTIAKSKVGDFMEYRVLEMLGNPQNGEVHIVISADNIGNIDKRLHYRDIQIIDETGKGYDDSDRYSMTVEGVRDNLTKTYLDHHPNAPYTINLYIKGYDRNAQYIKYLSMEVLDGSKHLYATFENLPIKWTEE